MGKRSQEANRRRRSFKRHSLRQKKKKLKSFLPTQPSDEFTEARKESPTPCAAICSSHSSANLEQSASDISDANTPSSLSHYTFDDSDISAWEPDSPSNVEDIAEFIPGHDCIQKAVEIESKNIVVVDDPRSIEVRLLSANDHRGSGVLRLSSEEYFRRMQVKETNGKLAIRCLRNQVEELKKKLATQEQQLQKEKRETIAAVREFWRDNVLEGGSRGGKMVKAALNKN